MSRTDAHTRYKHLPDGREYQAAWDYYVSMYPRPRSDWALMWKREWNTHSGRSGYQQFLQRHLNRSERHNAKAALRRGDYDSIPPHMTGRHSAAWLAY